MIKTYDSSYKVTQLAKESGISNIRPADDSNIELEGEIFVFNLSTINLESR